MVEGSNQAFTDVFAKAFREAYERAADGGGEVNHVLRQLSASEARRLDMISISQAVYDFFFASKGEDTVRMCVDPNAGKLSSQPPPEQHQSVAKGTPVSGARLEQANPMKVQYVYADGTRRVHEGGSLAWRNNNPGNLRYGDYAVRHGAIGENSGFAIFPDQQTGRSAQIDLIKNNYGSHSMEGLIGRYAPPSENDTEAYVKYVEKGAGISKSTKIESLSQAELEKLADTMATHEGWKAGTVYDL